MGISEKYVRLRYYLQVKFFFTYCKSLSTAFITTASTAIIIFKTQEDQGREHHLMTRENVLSCWTFLRVVHFKQKPEMSSLFLITNIIAQRPTLGTRGSSRITVIG